MPTENLLIGSPQAATQPQLIGNGQMERFEKGRDREGWITGIGKDDNGLGVALETGQQRFGLAPMNTNHLSRLERQTQAGTGKLHRRHRRVKAEIAKMLLQKATQAIKKRIAGR